jgi:hypothetical protein
VIRIASLLLVGFVVLALGLDAIIGVSQPVLESGSAEGVLHTFDDEGGLLETRLVVIDDGGALWIQSGHHFRGWYHRLVRNPDVELVRDGKVTLYRAVPLDTPGAERRVKQLLKERVGSFRFYLIRTLLLFADVKPVRLDPR